MYAPTRSLIVCTSTPRKEEERNDANLLEHDEWSAYHQRMAARLLGAGDLPHRGRHRFPGNHSPHPRLLHQRHRRYRRTCPLRHRRRLGAHHPAYTLRQGDKEPYALHHHPAGYHPEGRCAHHRLQLRDRHDDRLRLLPAEARTGLRRFRRHDIPPLPLLRRLVPEATWTAT